MLLGSILLAFAWAALQGDISLVNLLIGYGLGYVILALLAKGGVLPATLTSRTRYAMKLAGFFIRELVMANVKVAIDVVKPITSIQPAVVAIPLEVSSDAEILLLSMLINITPGSVTIDLSEDRRTLYVHVMHVTSPERSRRDIKDGFERRVLLLFRGSEPTRAREGTDD